MKKTIFTILSCLMLVPFASAMHHEASGHKISEAEVIKIARSAAPANVSGDATIMSSDGTILVEGTNTLSIQAHNVSDTSSDLTIIPFLTGIFTDDNSQGVFRINEIRLFGPVCHT